MERTLAMFLKENPFDYDAEQLCRLKREFDSYKIEKHRKAA